jgi:hypothetical protein
MLFCHGLCLTSNHIANRYCLQLGVAQPTPSFHMVFLTPEYRVELTIVENHRIKTQDW